MSDKPRTQVGQDSHVEVELIDEEGNAEPLEFDLVGDSAADFTSGRLSVNSPLGKAIRGKFIGDVVPYAIGDICQVRIISVHPLENKAGYDAAARRQAILDEAVRKAERTNADMFASSYSGKWGDYSTDEVEDMDEELEE
jgi:transcription elongation GreA/GreB family factor